MKWMDNWQGPVSPLWPMDDQERHYPPAFTTPVESLNSIDDVHGLRVTFSEGQVMLLHTNRHLGTQQSQSHSNKGRESLGLQPKQAGL